MSKVKIVCVPYLFKIYREQFIRLQVPCIVCIAMSKLVFFYAFRRQCSLYLTVLYSQEDGEIIIDSKVTFGNTHTQFKLNEPWEEKTAGNENVTTITG